jgi:hypothetical protein
MTAEKLPAGRYKIIPIAIRGVNFIPAFAGTGPVEARARTPNTTYQLFI